MLLDMTYFQGAGGAMHRRYTEPINKQDEWYPVGGPLERLVFLTQMRELPVS